MLYPTELQAQPGLRPIVILYSKAADIFKGWWRFHAPYARHARVRGTRRNGLFEGVKSRLRAFRGYLDGAIVEVSRPAAKTKLKGLPYHEIAKTDPLDTPLDAPGPSLQGHAAIIAGI